MRHPSLLAILSALATSSACGLGAEDDTPCNDAAGVHAHGEEFESPDGCVTTLCDDGVLTTLDDRRVTIAGDLALPSQEAVEEQSCLAVVEGTLRVSGTAADLTPLASLTRIGVGLEITGSEVMTTSGLEGVTEIGGGITITDNASLTALAFQPQLSAFGDVAIVNNDALPSLAGAEFLGQCGTCIAVAPGPTALVDPTRPTPAPAGDAGLEQPSGGTFYGAILIADNDALANVLAMSNLYYAWSDIRLRNNDVLTTLQGLQLVEVRGVLEVSEHAALPTTDVETFAAGVSVLGGTTICGNLDGAACP